MMQEKYIKLLKLWHLERFYKIFNNCIFLKYCTLIVNNEGIRVVIDDQHNQQASAYFKYEQFSDYNIRVNVCNLRVPISVFMV